MRGVRGRGVRGVRGERGERKKDEHTLSSEDLHFVIHSHILCLSPHSSHSSSSSSYWFLYCTEVQSLSLALVINNALQRFCWS